MDTDLYPKFPHLENLDRVPEVLQSPYIYISEKLHGFNARFGRTKAGHFWVGSRNQVVDPAVDRLQGFSDYALGFSNALIPNGFTIYGEWVGKGIQKGIDYGDEKRFYMFGLRYLDEPLFHPREAAQFADTYGLTMAPFQYDGVVPPMGVLDDFRKDISQVALGGAQREGIVIVPWPPIIDQYGHQVIAKFKAPSFSERAHARREAPAPPDMTNVQAFVDDYVTMERLHHVIGLLEENALPIDGDALDPKYTGDMLRTMVEDIKREGRDDFAKLNENEQKLLGKVSNAATKKLVDELRLARMSQGRVDTV